MKAMNIRELDPTNEDEIKLVAQRMQSTLIDVLGKERGVSLYTIDWLVARVKWHLDSSQTRAKIFLSVSAQKEITGQAIGRIEMGNDGIEFGYFSTIYIAPEFRRRGIAEKLLMQMHGWFGEMGVSKITYNTAENNAPLINLFLKHGYRITLKESEMVQLTKN